MRSPVLVHAASICLTAVGVVASSPVAQAAGGFDDFDSTVRIHNCSAALVRLPGSQDRDKALVLTNGHCVPAGRLNGTEVVVDQAWPSGSADAQVMSGNEGQMRVVRKIKLERIVYATMNRTDIAVVRTNTTYSQLASANVRVRALSTTRPAPGTAVNVPSAYWKTAGLGCAVDAIVPVLREGDWTWNDSMRLAGDSCTGLRPGASGSPMIDDSSGDIVGVVNTVQTGDGPPCSENNPCEGRNGVTAPAGTTYGQQTWWAAGCFKASAFNPGPACKLPRP
ncbi:trypsin-like peptidase domain-containing protein [Arsenicicoccus dermatophilus]|nr:trypsin-like peptidase domain-containing protein [Arsenicicoccus dermatophilus]MCH8614417.1 serine protease [Arsenicicoccus dermatophilus]